jgi:hypothetical protein
MRLISLVLVSLALFNFVANAGVCTAPSWQSQGGGDGRTFGAYYLHNNVWYSGAAPLGPQTTFGCNYNSWYVISNQNDCTCDRGAVKSYPNIHMDMPNAFTTGVPINNYGTIWTTWAYTSPGTGIYDVAYDVWMNGVGWGNGHTEYMIWTENKAQRPLGSQLTSTTINGILWDMWHYNDGNANVISAVPRSTLLSGTVDIKLFVNYGIAQGWMPANPSINQIGFGVEVVSTNGQNSRWDFTDFSITLGAAGAPPPPTSTTTAPAVTTTAPAPAPTTTAGAPASGCAGGVNLFNNGLGAGWSNFAWASSLTTGGPVPAGAPAGNEQLIKY